MSRLPSMSRDELTSEQRDEYDDLARTRTPRADGTIGGPFDAWLLSPELSHRLRGLAVMRGERTSPDRGRVELAIPITGRYRGGGGGGRTQRQPGQDQEEGADGGEPRPPNAALPIHGPGVTRHRRTSRSCARVLRYSRMRVRLLLT